MKQNREYVFGIITGVLLTITFAVTMGFTAPNNPEQVVLVKIVNGGLPSETIPVKGIE